PALYAAELIRSEVINAFGSSAYALGLKVESTIDSRMHAAAEVAVIKKLNEYDQRHGYRGPEEAQLAGTRTYLAGNQTEFPAYWKQRLKDANVIGDQHPAIVIDITGQSAQVLTRSGSIETLTWEGLRWARPYVNVNQRGRAPQSTSDILNIGDLIRIAPTADEGWRLGQVPALQAAFVALDPDDGAIRAMVGGYDFRLNQFNHATQARRQPGSTFKPFFYAGAMEQGITAASIYNDAPVVLPGGELEEKYRPKNSGSGFRGNIRLREALYRSINLVSLRVLLDYGSSNAIDYVSRFGFNTDGFPNNVQLAFGGGTIALTPLEIATGYAVFANGGRSVDSFLIQSVTTVNESSSIIDREQFCRGGCRGASAEQVVDPRVAFIMNSILKDTIQKGTGRKAFRALKRTDLMGKTGTTNDADIWFSGYNGDIAATAWAGFSSNAPVGNREWGSTTPIETWIDFAKSALPNVSPEVARVPDGIVSIKIDPKTGQRTSPSDPDGVFEYFRQEFAPEEAQRLASDEDAADYQAIF
ncbi:MAG: peptidase, partial [Pseudomonadales bacterium]|nr:peptidase [Pseudomonadales bacterium]